MCTSSYSSAIYRVSGARSNLLATHYTQYIQEGLFQTGKKVCGAFGVCFQCKNTLCQKRGREEEAIGPRLGKRGRRDKELPLEYGFW